MKDLTQIEHLRLDDRKFWYLATPYSGHPRGELVAFCEAAQGAATLLGAGVNVFCPITHSHPIATQGGLVMEHAGWMRADAPFMHAAHGIIVLMMDGWRQSRGIAQEIEFFAGEGKPVLYIRPLDGRLFFERPGSDA